MASERWRLLAALLLWAIAGALVMAIWQRTTVDPLAAPPTARAWLTMLTLIALPAGLGAWLASPLVLGRSATSTAPAAAPDQDLPAGDADPLKLQQLEQQFQHLQARLEHLPVAAWACIDGQVQALTSRARRLAAPGNVRDVQALNQLLASASSSGPLMLDTERGSERWQLQRQPLAIAGQAQTLLALVPLESELEAESLLAWRQLVQVLTHEIMNSLTPIKSLSQTAEGLLGEPDSEADLRSALQAIAQRAEGLAGFVATYRRVSQWPAPVLAPVELQALFRRLQLAVAPSWAARGGEALFEVTHTSLRLQADEGQLEQALLALLSNAEEATAETKGPRLWVQARQGRGGRLQISVRDNGPGVPPGLERQIFLPFFSAREGGQGIGLTVVRQLVHGMGGRVRHVRPIDGGAAFVLSF